jgi:protein-tyrosine phosphatase
MYCIYIYVYVYSPKAPVPVPRTKDRDSPASLQEVPQPVVSCFVSNHIWYHDEDDDDDDDDDDPFWYIYIVDIYIHTVSTLDKATYLIEKAVHQQGSVVLLEVVSAQTKQAGL